MADSGAFSGPRDAAVMEAILKEMGVEEYEPNVINQMLEFTYSKWITRLPSDLPCPEAMVATIWCETLVD